MRFLGMMALALGACAAAAACSDEAPKGNGTPDAAGDGRAPDPQGDAGAQDAATPVDAADARATDATDAADAAPSVQALFVGTDFQTAELSVVDLGTRAVLGRASFADQDSVPYASGGFGFVFQRGAGRVSVLDPARPWQVRATIDANDTPDAGSYASNPRAVVVAAGTKAYLARYASNRVKVVDVAAGTLSGDVDLAASAAGDDPDGLVEVEDGVYDATSGRVYFLLQRINQFDFSGVAPDYVGRCLTSHGMIVAIDAATGAAVDLNGGAAGVGLELLGANPGSLTFDRVGRRLIVVDAGCYTPADAGADAGPAGRQGRGVEAIDLTTGARSWLYETHDIPRLGGLVWIDGTRAYLGKGGTYYAWNPSTGALGAAAAGFPQAPLYDGAGRVIGLEARAPDAGDAGTTWTVVAWDIGTGTRTDVVAAPFSAIVPAAAFGVSSARLR